MRITDRNRFITVLLAALVAAALAAGLSVAAGSGHRAVATGSEQRAAGTATYWTPARMASAVAAAPAASSAPAQPADYWLTGNTDGHGLRWTHGGAVTRAVGKVFFTLGSTDYVCSGTAVDSPHADVVLTAAHCVSDSDGRWATNWVFVPGYQDGSEPYGTYPARRFFVSPHWPGSEQYDVAFVQVSRALPSQLPVAFGTRPALAHTYVFGYPSLVPYSGLYLNYCAGSAGLVSGGSARLACSMTAGDSGGPWFTGFSPRPGAGTVVAVSTYKLAGNMSVLYGAVLGSAAQSLYQQASA